MKAVQLKEYQAGKIELNTIEKPVPDLKEGEVLIRIAHSPINPSDLSFLQGQYGIKKKLPCIPGFEASGTVIKSGGGDADSLIGKNVAVTAPPMGDGSWAEYMKCPAGMCIELLEEIDLLQGSMLVVNPLTAISLVEIALKKQAKALIQTAAAGALGQMIYRYAKKKGLEVINIVRKDSQVKTLTDAGAEHVFNLTGDNFPRKLRSAAKKTGATVAVDAVGGELTGTIAQSMPGGSTIVVYGGLAESACQLHPGALIFLGQTVTGFWLSSAMYTMSPEEMSNHAREAQEMLKGELRSEVRAHFSLDDAQKAVDTYAKEMSGGKILISPQ